MKQLSVLLLLSVFLFFSCSDLGYENSSEAYINNISIKASGVGYGTYNDLFTCYTEGDLSNIIIDNDSYYKVSSNSLDAASVTTNEVTIKETFSNSYVKSIRLNLLIDKLKTLTIQVENNGVSSTLLSKTGSSNEAKDNATTIDTSIDVNDYIDTITLYLTLPKYKGTSTNSDRIYQSNYYIKCYCLTPIF